MHTYNALEKMGFELEKPFISPIEISNESKLYLYFDAVPCRDDSFPFSVVQAVTVDPCKNDQKGIRQLKSILVFSSTCLPMGIPVLQKDFTEPAQNENFKRSDIAAFYSDIINKGIENASPELIYQLDKKEHSNILAYQFEQMGFYFNFMKTYTINIHPEVAILQQRDLTKSCKYEVDFVFAVKYNNNKLTKLHSLDSHIYPIAQPRPAASITSQSWKNIFWELYSPINKSSISSLLESEALQIEVYKKNPALFDPSLRNESVRQGLKT